MRAIARWIHLVASWLFVGGVLVQGYLPGEAIAQLGGSGDFGLHAGVGYSLMGLLALLVLISSLLGRLPRRHVGLTILLVILYVVQTSLPLARESSPAIAALHPANAMVLLVVALVIAIRARPPHGVRRGGLMARLQRKRFSEPAEVRTFPRGKVDIVELDDVIVGRMTREPGWRWSVDVRPMAGTDRCQYHHLGVTLSGRLRVELSDGTELEIGPGDVFEIPPGHDAWVVGEEPWVSVDFAAMRNYGRSAEHRGERILGSILFTDIVDSTAMAQRLGDGGWLDLVAAHNERVQFVLNRYSGRIVKTTGDGILALFDGAERAVRAAAALHDALAALQIQLRAGIHTGEVELVAGDVRGVAVHAAARVMAIAGPGETLVSGTTRDLLDGTGLEFDDRGSHVFKGLSGKRPVFALKRIGSEAARDSGQMTQSLEASGLTIPTGI